MLVLTRRVGEEIVIDGDIRVTLVAIKGECARIGVDAPEAVRVDRQEVHERRAEELPRLTADGGQTCQLKGEYGRAIIDYTEAIRLDPQNAQAYRNRGVAYYNHGDDDRAIADYTDALRLASQDASTYHSRGLAHAHQGDYDRAVADYTEAIRLDPNDAQAYLDRGCALSDQGDYTQAIASLMEAIRLHPQDPWAYSALAWLWATCPQAKLRDGRKAITYARRACVLSGWESANELDALAAAHAECGQFDEAAQWANESLDFASEEQEPQLRARLDLYQEGKPYRQAKHEPGFPIGRRPGESRGTT